MTASNSLATPPKKKLPLLLKIYAVALIALSVISIPIAAILGFYLPSLTSDAGTPVDTTTLVIAIVQIALTGVGAVMSIVLGVRMLRDRRRGARIAAEILVAINVAVMVCEVMLSGLHGPGLYEVLHLVFLVAPLFRKSAAFSASWPTLRRASVPKTEPSVATRRAKAISS